MAASADPRTNPVGAPNVAPQQGQAAGQQQQRRSGGKSVRNSNFLKQIFRFNYKYAVGKIVKLILS